VDVRTLAYVQPGFVRVIRTLRLVLILSLLAACSPRGSITLVPEAASVGDVRKVFVGSTRGLGKDGEFGPERTATLGFARYDISVPPDRQIGEINWPPRHGKTDPGRQFLTTAEERYDQPSGFREDLRKELARNGGEAVIFIHGFNNTFAEGVYRIAQMAHDLQLPGAVVHYSWPSAAQPLGYVYDRDSALFARDGLEGLIDEVERAGAKRIVLLAHSMGSALTMETLRQIAIGGKNGTLRRIGGVVLISPDIDVDVFRAQAKAIPVLPQPFVIFSSERDRILKLSARLTGEADRLGTLRDLTRVDDLPITFLDTAAFNQGAGHFNLGNSPSLLRLMDGILSVDRAFDADRATRTGLLPGVVLTVQNATQIILRPVADIGTAR
jgi:esterase/lipase superfamily enzyme